MPRGAYPRTRKPLAVRFWAKVDKNGPTVLATPCWLWTGGASDGYGKIMTASIGRDYETVGAHQLSYFLATGIWPPEDTRHLCHNRRCVNPAHLTHGTRADNMQDMVAAGRSLVGELQPNHKLTWERVRAARSAHAAGQSARSLALEHGVSERTMRQCLAGETWKMEAGER